MFKRESSNATAPATVYVDKSRPLAKESWEGGKRETRKSGDLP
jgi:hypothetical protein